MRKQAGITLSGFIMWSIIAVLLAVLGFKIGPPYMEYFTIKKQLQAIAADPNIRSSGQRREVEDAFMKRSMIEDMSSLSPKDLVVTKEADGILISAEYTICKPIAYNLRACMDFAPTSKR